MATKFPMTADEFAEAIAEYCSERIAAERRATVERARERFHAAYEIVGRPDLAWIDAILDEEADR